MIEIRRTYTLDAAHHLPDVPDDHKCKRPHGHTWQVTVWIRGQIKPQLSWVMDYADLDKIWESVVHSKLDHRDLNEILDTAPTTERIVQWIYVQLEQAMPEGIHVSEINATEGEGGGCRLTAELARG